MKKLIVIEGIDCSGKTTIGKRLAADLGWRFEHEPTFSSKEADDLNFSDMNAWQREFYFMKDRLNHQNILKNNNCILDSYILRGLVYAESFSKEPEAGWLVKMMNSIYFLDAFKQPDLTIYIAQDPYYALTINNDKATKGLQDYNPKLTLDILTTLARNYKKHLPLFKNRYIVNPIKGDLESTYQLVKIYVTSFFSNNFLERVNKNENESVGSVS